jgi:hypothetical protein
MAVRSARWTSVGLCADSVPVACAALAANECNNNYSKRLQLSSWTAMLLDPSTATCSSLLPPAGWQRTPKVPFLHRRRSG